MVNASRAFLFITIIFIYGCSNPFSIPDEPESDFELSCLRWGQTITMCEGYVETEPVSGYMKIYNYEDDLYYGTTLYLCGADLDLNTGNPISDAVVGGETEDELLCVSGDEDELEWSWEDNTIFAAWNNMELEVYVPECYYDQERCATKGYGYISVY